MPAPGSALRAAGPCSRRSAPSGPECPGAAQRKCAESQERRPVEDPASTAATASTASTCGHIHGEHGGSFQLAVGVAAGERVAVGACGGGLYCHGAGEVLGAAPRARGG